MAPFSPRRGSPEDEPQRARLALLIAAVGIGAILLVYAFSPGVRHAVGHAAHTVKHDVGHVFDRDVDHGAAKHPHKQLTQPARRPAAVHRGSSGG